MDVHEGNAAYVERATRRSAWQNECSATGADLAVMLLACQRARSAIDAEPALKVAAARTVMEAAEMVSAVRAAAAREAAAVEAAAREAAVWWRRWRGWRR